MQLVIEDVGKKYPGRGWALQHFSLRLEPGILGLLGPNGAGKSTLMRILATLTKPSSGRVLWNGTDIARDPDVGVYPQLNALEFLDYIAAAKGLEPRAARHRIDELLELLNLSDARKRPLGGFSGGMRQRIGIAQALLNDPQLLIVDEPTAGLDPEERVRFRNLLTDLAGERIVLLSTHIVSDVESTASRIALIAQGQLHADATPEALLAPLSGHVWEWTVPAAEASDAPSRFLVSGMLRRGDTVQLRVISAESPGASARAVAPSLEDAYLQLLKASRVPVA